jgi:hypothetical protein
MEIEITCKYDLKEIVSTRIESAYLKRNKTENVFKVGKLESNYYSHSSSKTSLHEDNVDILNFHLFTLTHNERFPVCQIIAVNFVFE